MKNDSINMISLNFGDKFETDVGEFYILEELGEGGFATVYKALHKNKEIALKVIKMWNILPDDREEYSFRLQQEYKISQKFNSDNIIKIYGISELKGNPFLILELCENGSLRDLIPDSSLEEGNNIATSMLNGLEILHNEGIIHRDIKPQNILFGKKRILKLVDFGISGAVKNRVTKPNVFGAIKEIFATIAYSAPEQTDPFRAFKSLAPTLDIYSFGVTMYEYFTKGHLPFGDFGYYQKNMAEFNNAKLQNRWDRIRLGDCIGDSYWVEVIDKCLKSNPSERFKSVSEIKQILFKKHNILNLKPNSQDRINKVSSNWVLEIMQGDEIGRKYYLNIIALNYSTEELKMGWLDLECPLENQIGIKEIYTNYISSNHATLVFDNKIQKWTLKDGQKNIKGEFKNSKNGVIVNGSPILNEIRILQNGDIITLGFTTMKIFAI